MKSLIIFAKEPKKDNVKTRLSSCLSETQRLRLYKAFLKDTVSVAKDIQCEQKILAYDSESENPKYLKKITSSFIFYKQEGKNLGEKMHRAFQFAARNKASKIVIIGSDSPTLPIGYIKDAFCRLSKNDVVLGPSYDGGYYLIGLKKPCQGLFRDIKWGSDEVLEKTLKKVNVLNKKTVLMNKWYDVDRLEDLNYLKRDLKRRRKNIAIWTRKFLKI